MEVQKPFNVDGQGVSDANGTQCGAKPNKPTKETAAQRVAREKVEREKVRLAELAAEQEAKERLGIIAKHPESQLEQFIIDRRDFSVSRLVDFGNPMTKARVLKTICLSVKNDGRLALNLMHDEDLYDVVRDMASVKSEKSEKKRKDPDEEAQEMAEAQAKFAGNMAVYLRKIKAGPPPLPAVTVVIAGDKRSIGAACKAQLERIDADMDAGALAGFYDLGANVIKLDELYKIEKEVERKKHQKAQLALDKDDRMDFKFPTERDWKADVVGVKPARVQNYFPTAKKLFELAQEFPELKQLPVAPTVFKGMTTNNKFVLYFGDKVEGPKRCRDWFSLKTELSQVEVKELGRIVKKWADLEKKIGVDADQKRKLEVFKRARAKNPIGDGAE